MAILKFKRIHSPELTDKLPLPSYANPGDAGMDVRAAEDAVVPARGHCLVSTGLSPELPSGFELQVRSRSGLAVKSGISVLNSPGTIDEGYRGTIGVILANHTDAPFKVSVGDRIAQLVLAPVTKAVVVQVEEVADSKRGTGGFGSSGVK